MYNNNIFKLLNEWRLLPDYQLERRADIFFALYLPEIWKEKFGCDIKHDEIKDGKIVQYGNIIPEFPILIDENYIPNGEIDCRTSKVDYAVFCKEQKTIYLVELKTDVDSFKNEQLTLMKKYNKKDKLLKNAEYVINNAYDVLKKIKPNESNNKTVKKYLELDDRIQQNIKNEYRIKSERDREISYTDEIKYKKDLHICYIGPDKLKDELGEGVEFISFSDISKLGFAERL